MILMSLGNHPNTRPSEYNQFEILPFSMLNFCMINAIYPPSNPENGEKYDFEKYKL
jgi:hypothetical protein